MAEIKPPFDERGLPVGHPIDPALEVTPRQVKDRLSAGDAHFRLIDCRLPAEWEITRIDGARLVPLQRLGQLFDETLAGAENDEVIVYCRSGVRSLDFVRALQRVGFKNARSMAGGILAWNQAIEPGGPLY